ncbi:MAG: ScpA family protein [Candidatus Altiarchaeota archaeon]
MDRLTTLIETPDLSWRDILYEALTGLNPWDIDLGELASRYSKKVSEMKEMNFKIPANVILVSSVLLRMKADILHPRQDDPYAELADSLSTLFDGDFAEIIQSLADGQLEDFERALKPQRLPKRRVTADELIAAIQKALQERGARRKMMLEKRVEDRRVVVEEEIDIIKFIEETYTMVIRLLGKKEVVLFSELARTKDEIVNTLMSLLHLSNDSKLYLNQEHLFGEIYIRNTVYAD